MPGCNRLVRLATDLEVKNVEGRIFIPERQFLNGFDEVLLDEVLDELYKDPHAPDQVYTRPGYRQRILSNLRLCLATLSKIGCQEYIFRFCEDPRVGDDKIPIPNEILREFDSQGDGTDTLATAFYRKQFMFKPLTFGEEMRGTYINLPSEAILPVINKTTIKDGEGGWSVVYEIEIHPDYDKLGYSPQGDEKPHIYACKQLRSLDEGGEDGFRAEINIQYTIQRLSSNILPLLAAYKHSNKYRMIFPRADHSLRHHIQQIKPPETSEDQWAFLRQVLGIVDALHAIHDYKDTTVKDHSTQSQDQGKTVGSHRDLAPQNILVKDRRLLLADFGQAQLRFIKPGEDTGSQWVWGPSTYKAPECARDKFVGRGGDIWSLACIISEILTFVLLGKEGYMKYGNARRIEKRDSFHDNYSVKQEVIDWFKYLERESGYSKAVVGMLKLLQEMLHQNPKSRPCIGDVKDRLSKILQHQEPLCVNNTGNLVMKDFVVEEYKSEFYIDHEALAIEQTPPRTSRDRIFALSKLLIPFTNFTYWNMNAIPTMPWNWGSPAVTDPQSHGAEFDATPQLSGDLQALKRSQSHPVEGTSTTNRPPMPKPKFISDSMVPRTPLKDPLEGPLQALRGYDTVFLVDDSNVNDDEDNWLLMGQVLINLASVAMELDPDGVDIRFVESAHCDVDDVKSWKEVADAFCSVQPCGRRLLLGSHVGNILEHYIDAQGQRKTNMQSRSFGFKTQVNLIVLTDGQLDEDDDLQEIIKHCVQCLDAHGVSNRSIGVQFVLLNSTSGDSPSHNVYKYLDDDMASEINSMRDMVDTTDFNRGMLDDPRAFKKMLCGAINKKLDHSDDKPPQLQSSTTEPVTSVAHCRNT